jgi:hypothetical protein
MTRTTPAALLAACLALPPALAGGHDPAMHMQHMHGEHGMPAAPADTRQAVAFPAALREHTLANMRDHLLALQQIQAALAQGDYDQAGEIAEQRLGMSSLALHGAHDVAPYMPEGMKAAGTAMHRNASRLAVAARDAGATDDLKPVLHALANVTAQCVACHAGYRVK